MFCDWPLTQWLMGVVPDKHRVPRPGYSNGAYAARERDAAVAEFNDRCHGQLNI